jgi:S1-C subfamily serine protease
MTRTSTSSHIVSGVLGGLVAVVIGAILIGTGAIHTGETKTVVSPSGATDASTVAPNAVPSGNSVHDIYKRVGPGVAFIQAKVQTSGASLFGGTQQGTATGSGFALDKSGDILTNAHVVEGATSKDVQVRFGQQDPVSATIVGRDPSTDLAVLRIDPSKTRIQPLTLGNSDKVQVGDPAIAIGNPFGLENTVTTGIISAIQRSIDSPNGFSIDHVLQTDASINPGNSGGPLLDARGRVIGINAQIATGGGSNGSVGIGFAIPINTAKQVVPQISRHGHIVRAFIGVTTTQVSQQLARDLHVPVAHGAVVLAVTGPAQKAGLHAGKRTGTGSVTGADVIVEVAGRKINRPEDIAAAIGGRKPGDAIAIKLYRGGALQSLTLTLGERPTTAPPKPGSGGGGGILPFP